MGNFKFVVAIGVGLSYSLRGSLRFILPPLSFLDLALLLSIGMEWSYTCLRTRDYLLKDDFICTELNYCVVAYGIMLLHIYFSDG